jgi:hypothetical protein
MASKIQGKSPDRKELSGRRCPSYFVKMVIKKWDHKKIPAKQFFLKRITCGFLTVKNDKTELKRSPFVYAKVLTHGTTIKGYF